jgi:hypothetical protein
MPWARLGSASLFTLIDVAALLTADLLRRLEQLQLLAARRAKSSARGERRSRARVRPCGDGGSFVPKGQPEISQPQGGWNVPKKHRVPEGRMETPGSFPRPSGTGTTFNAPDQPRCGWLISDVASRPGAIHRPGLSHPLNQHPLLAAQRAKSSAQGERRNRARGQSVTSHASIVPQGQPEISQPRGGWKAVPQNHRVPEGRVETSGSFHRPSGTGTSFNSPNQPPCGWLISVVASRPIGGCGRKTRLAVENAFRSPPNMAMY